MTKLSILLASEQRQFDSPPVFEDKDRSLYFSVNSETFNVIQNLHAPINQVGFTLQLGYFKASGKFFTAQEYHKEDIEYVADLLGYNSEEIDILTYQNKALQAHRGKIMNLLHWQPLNNIQQEKIKNRIWQLVQQHLPLEASAKRAI